MQPWLMESTCCVDQSAFEIKNKNLDNFVYELFFSCLHVCVLCLLVPQGLEEVVGAPDTGVADDYVLGSFLRAASARASSVNPPDPCSFDNLLSLFKSTELE